MAGNLGFQPTESRPRVNWERGRGSEARSVLRFSQGRPHAAGFGPRVSSLSCTFHVLCASLFDFVCLLFHAVIFLERILTLPPKEVKWKTDVVWTSCIFVLPSPVIPGHRRSSPVITDL